MKREPNRIHNILLLVICALAVVLAALLVHKAYEMYEEKLHQEELKIRNEEVQSELEDIQMQIKELSGNGEALQEFLNQKVMQPETEETVSEAIVIPESSEKIPPEPETEPEEETETEPPEPESVTANEIYGEEDAIVIAIPEKALPEEGMPKKEPESVSVNELPEPESVSGSKTGETESVSGNQAGEDESVSGNRTGEAGSVSGNRTEEEESVSGNGPGKETTISGNAVVNGEIIPFEYKQPQPSLAERRSVRSSFAETMQLNGEDKARIAGSSIDFSDWKIACLGDSLTAGGDTSYPSVLKNILNAETVYNLGIGGSSYGRYWDQAFVDRYKEIPEDSDIIIVMGGTNDGFAASARELGNIEEKKPRTFYGDVDELMKGLKKNYPNAKIIFATPLPNVLHDYLMNQREYLLPQSVFADAVMQLAAENGLDVVDLYNSNLLDTHDAQIISSFMPDGVHGNPAGYQILAEHLASEIIRILERDALYGKEVSVSGNAAFENTVSGNAAEEETVSGNGTEEMIRPEEDTVSANDAAEREAERKARIREAQEKEQELSQKEQEEIEKRNREAAEAAEVIAPVKEEVQPATPAEEEDEEGYEYGGEAIVVR